MSKVIILHYVPQRFLQGKWKSAFELFRSPGSQQVHERPTIYISLSPNCWITLTGSAMTHYKYCRSARCTDLKGQSFDIYSQSDTSLYGEGKKTEQNIKVNIIRAGCSPLQQQQSSCSDKLRSAGINPGYTWSRGHSTAVCDTMTCVPVLLHF